MLSLSTAAACSDRWQGAPPSGVHSTLDHPQTADMVWFGLVVAAARWLHRLAQSRPLLKTYVPKLREGAGLWYKYSAVERFSSSCRRDTHRHSERSLALPKKWRVPWRKVCKDM